MAAQLIMPTLPGDQQQSRHFLAPAADRRPSHIRSQSYHVTTSARSRLAPISTADARVGHYASTPPSPTEASRARARASTAQANAANGLARPLYMPAVLRPNYEFPPHQPLSRSPGASSDSGSDSTLRRANTGSAGGGGGGGGPGGILNNLPGLNAIGTRLSRRSTAESCRSLDGEWNLDHFSQVTAAPTRRHWKPDTESTVCDDATCKRSFNYFNRRHHCRKCGNIFCDWHSSTVLPLDQDANFNPRAAPSRTCDHCFEQCRARHARAGSQGSGSTVSGSGARTPVGVGSSPSAIATGKPGEENEFGLPTSKELAASVPRDWNWSTF